MPFGLGIWEILILAGILVLLFGAKGAPGMARRLGSGVKEMKDAVTEMDPRSILDPKDEACRGAAAPARGVQGGSRRAAPLRLLRSLRLPRLRLRACRGRAAKPEGETPAS